MLESNAGWVGWIGIGLIVLSAASLISSFIWPIITKREAGYGFIGAFACFVFQYVLYVYGAAVAELAFWLSIAAAIVGGLAFAYPYVKAWKRRNLDAVGGDGNRDPSGGGPGSLDVSTKGGAAS